LSDDNCASLVKKERDNNVEEELEGHFAVVDLVRVHFV
jgi:hypothetical protein